MKKRTIAIGLAVIEILFFMTIPFHFLATNIATYGGAAFFLLSSLTWAFWPKKKSDGDIWILR